MHPRIKSCVIEESLNTLFVIAILNSFKQLCHEILRIFTNSFFSDAPVKPFFDIEVYKDKSPFFNDATHLVLMIVDKIKELLPDNWTLQKIVLSSHSPTKKSFHVVLNVFDNEGNTVLLQNVALMKKLFKTLGLHNLRDIDNKHLIDPSVYREGLFRTIQDSLCAIWLPSCSHCRWC